VLKAVADDPAEYDALYRLHHPRVLRLCRLLLSDPHEAEEVTQEVFLKLLREQRIDQRGITWGPWLTRVAVNACRDRRRSGWWKWWRERHAEYEEADLPGRGPTPEDAVLSQEQRRRIWLSFRVLSPRQQEVFVLRHVEGWSTEEVAESLGVSTGSIKRHLFRAVQQMRRALGGAA
jgi:RNA polymerase sigma-70 factor (ECF subfamily)